MKKIIFLLSTIAIFASCGKSTDLQDDIVTPDPAPTTTELMFSTSINAVTKVTDTAFESGDVVSVTAYDATGSLVKDAAQYKSNGSLFSSDDPIVYSTDDATYSFYAIYPAVSSLLTSLDFYALEDQSVAGAFVASDMLFASLSSSDAIPQLSFYHKMSSIVINIVGDASGAAVFNAKTGLRYGVKTGSVTTLGSSTAVTPASNGTASFKVILAPQTVASGVTLATYTVGGLVYDWVLDADFEMTSGKQYEFNWSLADREVTLVSVINGWDVVNSGTIESK